MLLSLSLVTSTLLASSFALGLAQHHHSDNTSHVPPHGGYKLRLARRSFKFVNDGVFDMVAFHKEDTRISQKYTKTFRNRQINLSDEKKAAQVRLREEALFEAARAIERRAPPLEEVKRLAPRRELRHPEKGRGHVPLIDVAFAHGYDVSYAGSASFGTPAQHLMIDFDTGSGDAWVLGHHAVTKHPHTKFNAQKSRTFAQSVHPNKWGVVYGSGSLEGISVKDRVSVGGYVIPDQQFGVAKKTLAVLDGFKIDGVMGLAFPAVSSMDVTSFMENLIHGKGDHPLPLPVASFHLQRGHTTGGEMCLGCIDDSMFKGELNYLPVKETELWQVECDGLVIGNTLIKGTKMLAALDTGSALMKVPTLVAQNLVKHLPGSSKLRSDGTITMPCNSHSVESFGFSFGGQTYKIPLVDIQMGIYDEADPSQCTFGIFADDRFQNSKGESMAILGDAFLKTVYSVFNYSKHGQASIGIAPPCVLFFKLVLFRVLRPTGSRSCGIRVIKGRTPNSSTSTQNLGLAEKRTVSVNKKLVIDGLMGITFLDLTGIVGVGFFMENLIGGKGNRTLPLPVVSRVSRHLQRNIKHGSEVCFDCIDSSKYEGTLKYAI
ncbi:BZ3500_MvSof-1268-A1-R1_Chr12-3g04040 [Microbotryum saponariae]|uniref:BZ3500_MvSof-1268-A1-R1_Chr12-3g04040 protein n=1 Tax=Microbotryum saponariae TaxID=289078 RepID=A0A2X0KR80_9BASI|nr:BZ3500_MvSof-1268-A1-R1_Chr12-3g04040 [Microbotryum saponariae]SDA02585.1 BZ3501_MvSof-1269-A2-R1_Chr12-3g03695 [Microbotryum saponariae]